MLMTTKNTSKVPDYLFAFSENSTCYSVVYSAQLGRLGGSRWGLVLRIKSRDTQHLSGWWHGKIARIFHVKNPTPPGAANAT